MSLSFGRFIFSPRLVPTLAAAATLALLLWLGFWQLDRASQKQALVTAFARQTEQPVVAVGTLSDLAAPAARFRQVEASGMFDSRQVLLDNQVRDGRPGYHVYTPLRLAGSERALLVNRGWVALGASRAELPPLDIAADTTVTITGRLSQPANPGILLADRGPPEQWPRGVQHIDYQDLSRRLGYALEPAVLLLDPQAAQGYLRAWQPTFGGMQPARHRGYAVQWFALAATLGIIYIALAFRRTDRGTHNLCQHRP